MVVVHPPGRMARPDQVDECHGLAEPRLTKRIELPLMFFAELGIHGVHAGKFGFECTVVLEENGALAAQLDEIAVDEAIEDRDLRLCDRHGRRKMKMTGEERNGMCLYGC